MKLDHDVGRYFQNVDGIEVYVAEGFSNDDIFSALTQLNLGDFSTTIARDSFHIAFVERRDE